MKQVLQSSLGSSVDSLTVTKTKVDKKPALEARATLGVTGVDGSATTAHATIILVKTKRGVIDLDYTSATRPMWTPPGRRSAPASTSPDAPDGDRSGAVVGHQGQHRFAVAVGLHRPDAGHVEQRAGGAGRAVAMAASVVLGKITYAGALAARDWRRRQSTSAS